MVGYIGSKHGAINPLEILYHRATVRGIPVGSRESFEAMNRAIETNKVRPVIDKVFPWTDAVAAIRYMQEGKHLLFNHLISGRRGQVDGRPQPVA